MKATFVSVLVPHYLTANVISEESVSFSVFRNEQHFKVVPHLDERARKHTRLPEEVSFTLFDHCIVPDSTMNEETLEVIKSIIQEVEQPKDQA